MVVALVPTINAFTAQLATGARQYNEITAAARKLVSPRTAVGLGPTLAGAIARSLGAGVDELGARRRLGP